MIDFEKSICRANAQKVRASFTDEYRLLSEKKVLDFIPNLNLSKNQVLGFYWPKKDEFNVKFLIDKLHVEGFKISLPVMSEKKEDKKLLFRFFDNVNDLKKGKFDIWEPNKNKKEVVPDVLFVPFLAFDLNGYRLGYGGGYYDVTIHYIKKVEKKVLKIVGIGYFSQMVEKIPFQNFDEKMDGVLTEKGYFEIKNENIIFR